MRIAKHVVMVGDRRVHYLRAGTGPALVLLHASACSAKVMRPLIDVFAERFTVIAPDTPGFGLSDKLALTQPTIADLADALAQTLDALGIAHTAVYGRHTGASIAVEFAARHPTRCAMALTDGYPILSGDYDEARIAAYLQPIVPSWDGTHLVWLWFRYRDQHVFWPWNAQTLAARADTDVPDLDFLHRGVVEFLEAGNDYRLGYAAAFRHDGLEAFGRLKVPVCFGTRQGDWLHRQVPLYPAGTWHEEMPRDAPAAARRESEILLRHPARSAAPPAPRCATSAGRTTLDYVDIGDAHLLVRSIGRLDSETAPVLVLHHAPGSSALYDDLIRAIGAARPALAVDLPGHGESDPLPGNPQAVETWAAAVQRALAALGIGRVHLYGHNAGAAVAVELARRDPARVATLILDAPIALDDSQRADFLARYAPDITPTWEGAHLLRAWHHARDQELWWPWFDRRREAIRTAPPRIDPEALTVRVLECLKQPASYTPAWRTTLAYPMTERLRDLAGPLALMGAASDVFAPVLAVARAARPTATVLHVEDSPASRAETMIRWLSDSARQDTSESQGA